MFDAVVLEKLLDMLRHVFPPAIRAEGFNLKSYLQFHPHDEHLEILSDLRLLFEGQDADLVGLVVYEGDEILESLIGLCG
jgi:hypothetical protein